MVTLRPYLRLLRIGTLFSPGADVIAGLCLLGLPWSLLAVRAILASICIYAAGMVLNDFADRGIDQRQRPERPLPRGDIAPRSALQFGLTLLGAGVLLAPAPLYHLLLAGLVLAYDFGSKRIRALGAINMGLLRGLNLASACMLVSTAPTVSFAPLLVAAVAYGLYIVAVTVLGILEDLPAPAPRTVLLVQSVPPVAALTGIAFASAHGTFVALALAALPALRFGFRLGTIRVWDQRAIRGSMLWLLLGTMLYTSLLCAACNGWPEAIAIAACIAPARWIARRIALT